MYLRHRLAHPQPAAAAPPYNGQAFDTRTGSASQVISQFVDVNAGAGAVTARRIPGLTAPVPAAMGPTITVSARYQNLLTMLQRVANRAGLGIEIRDLVFYVFDPAGPTAVFSAELGTLAGWTEAREAPTVNYVYVAGGGRGVNRIIKEYGDTDSVAEWGRIEGFDDRRDTVATAELDQAGAEVLTGIPTPELALTALDTASQQFISDWQLGDKATVADDAETIVDVIREVFIDLAPNTPPLVTPTLGGRL